MRTKETDHKYRLGHYLNSRKSESNKSPRAPSGFMKKSVGDEKNDGSAPKPNSQ